MPDGPVTGKQLVKRWFDELERQLTEEARRAGLLGHPSMTGHARESGACRLPADHLK